MIPPTEVVPWQHDRRVSQRGDSRIRSAHENMRKGIPLGGVPTDRRQPGPERLDRDDAWWVDINHRNVGTPAVKQNPAKDDVENPAPHSFSVFGGPSYSQSNVAVKGSHHEATPVMGSE